MLQLLQSKSFGPHALPDGWMLVLAGNPGEYTVKELAEKVLSLIPESKSKLVYRPLPGDDPKRRKPDIELAKALLGWEPKIALEEGLKKTIEYFTRKTKR